MPMVILAAVKKSKRQQEVILAVSFLYQGDACSPDTKKCGFFKKNCAI